jgi:hypothetical protein
LRFKPANTILMKRGKKREDKPSQTTHTNTNKNGGNDVFIAQPSNGEMNKSLKKILMRLFI